MKDIRVSLSKDVCNANIFYMHKRMSPHGNYDHMGKAINLVNNFKEEKVIFNCGKYNKLEKEKKETKIIDITYDIIDMEVMI